MSLLKNTVLASLLMLAAVPAQAGDLTRARYQAACIDAGLKAGNDSLMVGAVCNCAAQLISFVGSEGKTRDSDFNIPDNHPLVGEAIQACVKAHNSDTSLFMEKFGTLSVNNGKSQEGS